MKTEILSDHPGALLKDTERALREAKIAEARWRRDLFRAEADVAAARHGRSWRRSLLRLPSAEEHVALAELDEADRQLADAAADREELHGRSEQQRAGVDGEEVVAGRLAAQLSDAWRLLRGYHNGQGETDMVLVGPRGVWAIEVKAYRARLYIDGDRWWYQRPDDDDEPHEATDGSGRTWAQQVNAVADGLAAWLADQHHPVVVRRAVLLINEQASIEVRDSPGVDLVGCDPAELVEAVGGEAAILRADECKAIRHLVRRDHRFHLRKRVGREGRNSGSTSSLVPTSQE